MPKSILVLSFFSRDGHLTSIRLLCEEGSGPFFFLLFHLSFFLVDFSHFSVQIFFTFTEAFSLVVSRWCTTFLFFFAVVASHDLLSFLSLLQCDHVSIKNLDLGHCMNQPVPVVGLFSQWISKKVQLMQEGKALQELNKLV